MNTIQRTDVGCLLMTLLIASGCHTTVQHQDSQKSEVLVLGMIHSSHRKSEMYGIDDVQRIVRRVKPDYVLCEIPPDRLERALREFNETGKVTEPRVRVFPEYVDAIFPLMNEMSFEIIACAGWTKEMADDRRRKLEQWKTSRADEYTQMKTAQDLADERIEKEGLSDNPFGIHTERYDQIVREGMEPYNRLFNNDLGLGGWDNINAAHYALIEKALDSHQDEGKRFLITFGAWHKYWFLDKLRSREDIELLKLGDFINQGE